MCLINPRFGVDSDSICILGIIGIIGYLNRGKLNLDGASRQARASRNQWCALAILKVKCC